MPTMPRYCINCPDESPEFIYPPTHTDERAHVLLQESTSSVDITTDANSNSSNLSKAITTATSTTAIQISPEAGLRNATSAIIRTANDDVIPMPMALTSNRTLGKEISTSERTRRLIPYMAFYLPPTEFPINQQYVVQVPSKQLQHQSPPKSQKQQQAPAAIPLPTAYVHMKVPINNQHAQSHHGSLGHHHSPSQPAFQTIVYGGQHPLTQVKESGKLAVKIPPPPQHSLLPPNAASGGSAAQRIHIPIAYKEGNLSKLKSVGQQQQYHQQLQPPSVHSQKINLTPFTPTNTVPGHFIPIIYSNEQPNNINYKPTAPSTASIDPQQQQQQHHQYNELAPSSGQLEEHQLQHQSHSSAGAGSGLKQHKSDEYHRHRQHGEIVVTIPASPGPAQELVPKTLSQLQQQERQHVQYVPVSPAPAPTPSSTFRVIDVPTENRHQQLHHHHQTSQFFEQQQNPNADNLTPQQKYVIYLQQQLRYKQQQQLKEHQEKHVQLEKHLQAQSHSQHYQLQQPAQQEIRHYPQPDKIYVLSTTASPVAVPSSTPHPTTQPIDVHHDNHHNQNRFNEKYPQHSPISHVVYQHPEMVSNADQILHAGKQSTYPLSHRPEGHRYAQHQLQPHQYASNPSYVEYVIDDPKQEIEEHSTSPEKDQPHHSIRPPPVLLVSSPVPAPPPVEVVVTSPRPLYKNQPTLRLHAISPTPRPSPRPHTSASFGSQKSTPAPPMVFVSSKPKYTQLFPTASPVPVKLHPSQKYTVNTPTYAPLPDDDPLPDIKTSSLAEILRKLQESNHLPQTLTPDNIDNSIRTLIKILHNLKGSQTIVENPPQHHEEDYDYNNAGVEDEAAPAQQDLSAPIPSAKPGPNSGRPGIDYPTLARIPETSFDCQEQRYKGFFGDPETNCQVWHYCDLNGGKASFLCPNGTIFSQIALTCDWWFNVKCATTPQLYVLNERLYKYILPFTPKFPEDYSGPLVDKYLALKFKEMEEKMRREKLKGRDSDTDDDNEDSSTIDDVTQTSPDDGSTEAIKNKNEGGSTLSAIGEQSSERNLLIDEENGRIASRGSGVVDAFSSTEAVTKELPLSLQPIVVSTTASPFSMQSEMENAKRNGEPTGDGGDKVSVEKVEVIEIKSDGTSGHLIPDRRYSSADT